MNEEIEKILNNLYEQYKQEPMTREQELDASDDFRCGAEYGRSEVLRKIIEHLNSIKQ